MTSLTPLHTPAPAAHSLAWLATAAPATRERVARRVVAQLLQTLLYENVLPYQCQPNPAGGQHFCVEGRDAEQAPVYYRCAGLLSESFAIIRLRPDTLERVDAQGQASAPELHQALAELLAAFHEAPHWARFVQELEHTLLKDLQARAQG